jgi:hypothetical protein
MFSISKLLLLLEDEWYLKKSGVGRDWLPFNLDEADLL